MKNRSARAIALEILIEFEQKQAYSNLLLHHHLSKSQLKTVDKRLVTELVYGVIQRLSTLDWLINQLVKKGVASLEPWVKQTLRLGLYQLMYLDRIPPRAAVFETVSLAKKRGHAGIAKLINGVLRAYLRKKDEITFPDLATKYAFPPWLVKRMISAFGQSTAEAMMGTSLRPPKVSIRVNCLRTDHATLERHWGEQVTASVVSKDGMILHKMGNPVESEWYQKGYYTVQDESSMLVAHALSPSPGMAVLDVCAAPGGKTTHLAELMNNQGSILASDLHPHKLKLIDAHATRLGIDIIQTQAKDMRTFHSEQSFDAILLDAPCSGFGVIQRKPEIKWRRSQQEITALVQLQQDLLQMCTKHLKPGGILLYSTCTWEPTENQEQIKRFLAAHPDFQPDLHLPSFLPTAVNECAITGQGWVQILPHHFQSDGFFIARLIKNG